MKDNLINEQLEGESENFGRQLIAKIEKEKLTPRPRWVFSFRDYAVWFFGLLSLFLGACAFAVIIYLEQYDNFAIYQQIGRGFPSRILLTLPYFWLVSLFIFISLIYFNFKYTKSGYRYSLSTILAVSVSLSIILGTLFFAVGLGERIDDALGRRAPFYDRVINPHLDFWSQPDEGRLAGVVESLGDDDFRLIDRNRKVWLVDLSQGGASDTDFPIFKGLPLRLLGEKTGSNSFIASRLLPLGPGRNFFPHP